MRIIIDGMDQKKMSLPYFVQPPKCVSSDYVLKTKVTAAIVHGDRTYSYWCTPLLKHTTNLTLECLRRTLLQYQDEKGYLPLVLYLQLDNAPDNKFKCFLAFIAYLIKR